MPESNDLKEAARTASRQSVGGAGFGSPAAELSVATPCDDYAEMSEHWALIDALLGGTRAMRAGGETWLPMEAGEEDEEYAARLQRTALFNAFRRTRANLTGRVFRKELQFIDVHPRIETVVLEDVDRMGSHASVFARDVFATALAYGLCHVIVDQPRIKPGARLSDERRAGVRPHWRIVRPHDLIGWRSAFVDGVPILTQIRMRETATEDAGPYATATVNRIRVIYLDDAGAVRFELHEEDRNGKYHILPEEAGGSGVMSIDRIPVVTFYAAQTGIMTAEPPLADMADVNLQHYQSSSDQRNILHVARVPILFGQGMDIEAEDITVGGTRVMYGPSGASLDYVEHSGKAIESGRQDLADLEEHMRTLGMELLVPKAAQTATQRTLDAVDTLSPLQEMSLRFSDAMENLLALTARWMQLDPATAGKVKTNTEFGIGSRDPAEGKLLREMRQSRDLSQKTLWQEMRRRSILGDDFDEDEELARLEFEAPEPLTFDDGDGALGGDDGEATSGAEGGARLDA